jgi:hypothetical protein
VTLRQFVVPNPAKGTDWLWTVPGQYLARVVSITATLTSNTPPGTLADSSGNGWTLTEGSSGRGTYGVAGPFAGGANNRGANGDGTTGLSQACFGVSALSAQWVMAAWSVDYWANVGATNTSTGFTAVADMTANASNGWQALMNVAAGSPTDARIQTTGGGSHTFATDVVRGAWHHYGFKWDGATRTYYFDGANIASSALPAASDAASQLIRLGGGGICPMWLGGLAAVAVYPAALADARFAAHAGANADQATYKTSVLADTPRGFWLLDELMTTVQRTASLRMTDGTRTLAMFPGFSAVSSSGVFTWTWASASPGNAQNANQTVTQVVIADETLAPGYTVGTSTPDLGSGDQWSNITVWADVADSGGAPGGAGDGTISPGYLNALLVPDYSHRGA